MTGNLLETMTFCDYPQSLWITVWTNPPAAAATPSKIGLADTLAKFSPVQLIPIKTTSCKFTESFFRFFPGLDGWHRGTTVTLCTTFHGGTASQCGCAAAGRVVNRLRVRALRAKPAGSTSVAGANRLRVAELADRMPAPSLAAETLDLMPRVSPQNAVAIEAALDRFLRGVERRAYRHAQLACRQHEDALDVVQEAMLAFVRRYRQHPSTDWPLLFWRVLDSKLVDLQRRRSLRGRWFGWLGGRVDEDSEEDPFAHIADPAEPGPLGRLGDSEAAAALDLALRALPLRQRQAFLLRVWEGFDVAQTAQALGISEGSVKTHLFRALQSLRARLENHL